MGKNLPTLYNWAYEGRCVMKILSTRFKGLLIKHILKVLG